MHSKKVKVTKVNVDYRFHQTLSDRVSRKYCIKLCLIRQNRIRHVGPCIMGFNASHNKIVRRVNLEISKFGLKHKSTAYTLSCYAILSANLIDKFKMTDAPK